MRKQKRLWKNEKVTQNLKFSFSCKLLKSEVRANLIQYMTRNGHAVPTITKEDLNY